MAFAGVGTIGTGTSKTSGQTTSTITVATNALAAGNLAVVCFAMDNSSSVNGDEGAVSGVVDTGSGGSNTWVKALEFCNANTGADTGATISIWYSNIKNAVAIGGTITATLTNSAARKATANSGWKFTKATGFDAVPIATNSLANNSSTSMASLNATTASVAALRLRSTAIKYGTTTATLTPTSGFTKLTDASIGTTSSGDSVRSEFVISTATGAASAPATTFTAAVMASAYVAFQEQPHLVALTANPISSAAASSLGTPILLTQVVLPAANPIASAFSSTCGQPVLNTLVALPSATPIASAGIATAGTPVLGQVQALAASAISSAGVAALGIPVIQTTVPLPGATAISCAGVATLGTPAIAQAQVLVPIAIASAAVSALGSPVIHTTVPLPAATAIGSAGVATFGSVSLVQVHILFSTSVASNVSTLDTPVFATTPALIAAPIISLPASADTPVFTQSGILPNANAISCAGIATLGTPALGQAQTLAAASYSSVVSFDSSPTLVQNNVLAATPISSAGVATLGTPTLETLYTLPAANPIASAGVATLGPPAIGQVQILGAQAIASADVATLAAGFITQVHTLTAVRISSGVATVGGLFDSDFTSPLWQQNALSSYTGGHLAPDGTYTAWQITEGAVPLSFPCIFQSVPIPVGGPANFSVYASSGIGGSPRQFEIDIGNGGSAGGGTDGIYIIVDLSLGTVLVSCRPWVDGNATWHNISGSIDTDSLATGNAGNGWYLVQISANVDSYIDQALWIDIDKDLTSTYIGQDGVSNLFIWHPTFNYSLNPVPYTPSTVVSLSQNHTLSATPIVTLASSAGTAPVVQKEIPVVTLTAIFDSVAIVQSHVLWAANFSTGPPVFDGVALVAMKFRIRNNPITVKAASSNRAAGTASNRSLVTFEISRVIGAGSRI